MLKQWFLLLSHFLERVVGNVMGRSWRVRYIKCPVPQKLMIELHKKRKRKKKKKKYISSHYVKIQTSFSCSKSSTRVWKQTLNLVLMCFYVSFVHR